MSDFEDKLNELKRQLEDENATKVSEPEVAPEPEAEEPKEEATEPAAEEVKEPVAEPEKPVEDEKKAKVSAYEERKAKKAEKEVERLQAELIAERAARLAVESATRKPAVEEPSYEADPDAAMDRKLNTALSELEEFKRERLVTDAVNEFQGHVKAAANDLPDIEQVIDAGFSTLCQSIALMSPGASKAAIEKAAKMSVLQIASAAIGKGENPAEAGHDHFTRNGIKAQAKAAEAEVKPSEAKKLEAVVKNKAKTGSPLSGGGAGGSANLSKDSFMKMTPAQYYKLSSEERARIMSN